MKLSNIIFTLSILLIFSCKETSDPLPSFPFEKTYGGTEDDVANAAIIVDGYLYAYGTSMSFGDINGDPYLIKTDLEGNLVFEKTYGNAQGENGKGIVALRDGNLLLFGSRKRASNDIEDIHLIKIDTAGNILWEQTYGGELYDDPDAIIEMSNGELCIAATTVSFGAGSKDMYLLWTDPSGNLLREKTFGGPDLDGCASIMEIENQELMLHAYTKNYGATSRDMYLLKMNATGDSLWSKRFGTDEYEQSEAFLRTSDGGYLIAGHSAGLDPDHDMYGVRFDRDGNQLWAKTWGGEMHDGCQAVLINSLGNYVFVARSMSFDNGNRAIYMVTTNPSGDMIKADTLGGPANDWPEAILEDNDFYFVVGHTNSFGAGGNDVYVVKTPF